MLDQLPDAAIVLSKAVGGTEIVRVNQAFCTLLERDGDAAVLLPPHELLRAADAEAQASLHEAIAQGKTFRGLLTLHREHGASAITVDAHGKPMDRRGSADAFYLLCLRRPAEPHPTAMAAQGIGRVLESVYEHSDLGICISDADGVIQRVNKPLAELLGKAEADLLGQPIAGLIGQYSGGSENQITLPDIMGGVEWVARSADRSARTLVIRGWPLDPNDPRSILCFTLSDVTGRKKAEIALMRARDEAEVASRAKSAFLANMSHELRTPLNAIIGFSEIIESEFMGPLGEPRYLEYVSDIHRSANHLLEIINNILDISKIEAGRLELHEESIDVVKLLDSSINLIRERAQRHGVTLAVDTDNALPLLLADATKLRQILINLLSNAVKFTPEGGQVSISAQLTEDNETVFTIADTGIGMSEHELETAMEPFGQVDSDLARRFEGTGLGLPLTKALVELHGGALQISSRPGEGTRAEVVFPADRSVMLPALFGGA